MAAENQILDISNIKDDSFVIRYGGEVPSINALTFTQSLMNISKALLEINSQASPELKIEVVIQAIRPGSFRSQVRLNKIVKILSSFLPRENVLIILIMLLQIFGEDKVTYEEEDNKTVVFTDKKTIITNKIDVRLFSDIRQNPQINNYIQNNYSVLNNDQQVTGFSIARDFDSEEYLLNIPREDFSRLSEVTVSIKDGKIKRIPISHMPVRIVKPAYEGDSMWTVRYKSNIQVKILDIEFLKDFQNNTKSAPPGSSLIVDMIEKITYDNDLTVVRSEYEILKVHEVVQKNEPMGF